MKCSVARPTIRGISPLSQSRQHGDPFLEGEAHDDYDLRTWRSKLNVDQATGLVVIPAHGMHQAIAAAAKYSGKKIPGQRQKTWTAKFTTGIALFDDVATGIRPDDVQMITISANSDGVRGSGKRVTRRFPIIPMWSATFEVMILDLRRRHVDCGLRARGRPVLFRGARRGPGGVRRQRYVLLGGRLRWLTTSGRRWHGC